MTLDKVRENLRSEKDMIVKARSLRNALKSDPDRKSEYKKAIVSLLRQINLLNRALPLLLRDVSPLKSQSSGSKLSHSRVSFIAPSSGDKKFISLERSDKRKFLEELQLSEVGLRSARKSEVSRSVVRRPNGFVKLSNRFFRGPAESLVPVFGDLGGDLKKANIPFFLSSYLAMALFSSLLSLFLGLLLFGSLLFVDLSNIIHVWIPIVFPLITFLLFYVYPAGVAGSLQKSISQELPFATIHMAAIASSDIEPSKIFRIIASSREYPAIGREFQKIVSQVQLYGYDLVTALKNVASLSSNERFSDLLSGLATNINTGGALKNFLEKKADSFLLDYRLERKRYSQLAGTFMDVYISVLIAAPLILMMMFIIMSVSGLGIAGLSTSSLMYLSIGGIVLVNIIFLVVLNFKQPKV